MNIDLEDLKYQSKKLDLLISFYGKFYLILMIFYLLNKKFVIIKFEYFSAVMMLIFWIIMKILMLKSMFQIRQILGKRSFVPIVLSIILPFGELLFSARLVRQVENYVDALPK